MPVIKVCFTEESNTTIATKEPQNDAKGASRIHSLLFSEATVRASCSDIPAKVKERQRSAASFPGSFTGQSDMNIWFY